MRWLRPSALALIATACGSCSLPENPPAAVLAAENTCLSNDDCKGGTCVTFTTKAACGGDGETCTCLAGSYGLTDLTFVVTTAALSGSGAGRTYVIHSDALPVIDFNPAILPDITLPPLTEATMRASAPTTTNGVCAPPQASTGCAWKLDTSCSLPVRATLRHADIALGIPGEIVSATSATSSCAARKTPSDVCVDVTAGTYDLYLEPTDTTCPIPPALVAGVSSASLSSYAVAFPAPQRMLGTILTSADLTDYQVEIVDAVTGLRVSNVGAVGPTVNGAATFGEPSNGAFVPLEYYPPLRTDGDARHFWIRFSPRTLPLPSFAEVGYLPVFLADMESPVFDFTEITSAPTTAAARIEDAAGNGVAGTVVLASLEGALLGVPLDIVSSFAVSATTATGDLLLSLPPGKYGVSATPAPPSKLAMTQTTWDVAKSNGAVLGGEVFSLAEPTMFFTRVVTPSGASAPNVVVSLDPASPVVDPFDAIFGVTRPVPRGGSGITDASGVVGIPVDPGAYTLRVRFESSSELPWVTMPVVDTGDPTTASITAELPVEVDGRIVAQGVSGTAGVLGGTLRVYAQAPASMNRSTLAPSFPERYYEIGEAQIAVDVSTSSGATSSNGGSSGSQGGAAGGDVGASGSAGSGGRSSSGDTSQRGRYRVLLPPVLGATSAP